MKLGNFLKLLISFVCFFIDLFLLFGITLYPLKGSSISFLIHSNILKTIIISAIACSLINGAIYSISYLISLIDHELATKFEEQALKLSIILSILIGMLTIETPEQFEMVATLVSFILIFNFFFPKEFPQTIAQIKTELIHKWNSNKKKKHQK
ncbi:hypothetical protein AALA17_04225 [Lactobacillaceae bacterium 24-114]